MIKFKLEGKIIESHLETGTNSRPTVVFRRECASELEAELLYRLLDKTLDDKIEAVRKMEYESGWSDHRKRKEKRDFFYIHLTTKPY